MKATICTAFAAVAFCALPPVALGGVGDPNFVFTGPEVKLEKETVKKEFSNPCGLAVDSTGNFLVSSFYDNKVMAFTPTLEYDKSEDLKVDSSCSIAINSSDVLYANVLHQTVLKVGGDPINAESSTGVSIDPIEEGVYVNARDHISIFDENGNPVEEDEEPVELGVGELEDGYGIAVSGFPETLGLIYVGDAATDTVKAFSPGGALISSFGTPDPPFTGFNSLRDSAIAVDRVDGTIYVADHLGPENSELPESVVYAFKSNGEYKGRLKYNVIDPGPVGLAVDNRLLGFEQGTVYVTSGNFEGGAVYSYPPDSAVASGLPATSTLSLSSVGSGSGSVTSSSTGIDCEASCTASLFAGEDAVLEAVPAPGSEFVGWAGADCSGTTPCTVTMDAEKSVVAEFASTGGEAPQGGASQGAVGMGPQQGAPASQPRLATTPRAKKRHRRAKRRHGRGHVKGTKGTRRAKGTVRKRHG